MVGGDPGQRKGLDADLFLDHLVGDPPVFDGAFNTSGPPALFHISGRQMTTMESVASLNFFIFCTSLLVLAYHIASGHITEKVCMALIKLLPFMAAGMVAGGRFSAGLNQNRYRKGLFVLLTAFCNLLPLLQQGVRISMFSAWLRF